MTRRDALRALERAVKAGTLERVSAYQIHGAFAAHHQKRFIESFHGSLDAAKALHDAVLPGWVARPQIGGVGAGVTVWHCTIEDWNSGEEINADNQPSAGWAWLLAIIRALIAQEGGE